MLPILITATAFDLLQYLIVIDSKSEKIAKLEKELDSLVSDYNKLIQKLDFS